MNERIKLLAEQATDTIEIVNPDTGITHHRDFFDQEKFAELIVRETLMQMAIQMNRFGDDQANNPAWYKSEEAVKKHFGVEE